METFSENSEKEALSFGVGMELNVMVDKYFDLGFRYDRGLVDLGTTYRRTTLNGGFSTNESQTKNVEMLGVIGRVNLSRSGLPFFAGLGIHYIHKEKFGIRFFDANGDLKTIIPGEEINKLTSSYSIGAQAGKWEMGYLVTSEEEDLLNHHSVWVGYNVVSAKRYIKRRKRVGKTLPRLLFEFSSHWNVPILPKYAATNTLHIEPKYLYRKKNSIGVQFALSTVGYGTDQDFDVYFQEGIAGGDFIRKKDRLNKTWSIFLMHDFYRKMGKNFVFFGAGIGYLNIDGLESVTAYDYFRKRIKLKGEPTTHTLGAQGRVGMKIGWFRPSIGLNLGLKKVPPHIVFGMGLEPGFFRKK